MPDLVPALSVPSPGASFRPALIERRQPRPHDVVIDIAFAGICHSDIHQVREEWGSAIFPMVPGHEIAGTVVAVGEEVTRFAPGDRAGVGVFVDSCRECEHCLAGLEQYCLNGFTVTYNGRNRDGEPTYGGYSRRIVVDERYTLRIPEALPLDAAAPLMCAGITMYSPLRHFGAGPRRRVAVLGMGGLGHLGVKLAAALGAEVTVLGQSLSKRDDGVRFGATDYRSMSDPRTARELARSFDLIVNTVSTNVDLDAVARLLALDGVLCNVGLPSAPDQFHVGTLASMRRSVTGSNCGGIAETQEMLDFCAEHGVAAEIEKVAAEEVEAAYDRVVASDVRYRFVIDVSSIEAP